jgi:hypothetical protein
MRTLHKRRFKLPFIGRERFRELAKMGVSYQQGFFFISNLNNVEKIVDSLSEILKEEVIFTQTCHICNSEFLCTDCNYYGACPSRNLPFHCICKTCFQQKNCYEQYIQGNTQKMKTKS